MKTEPSKATYLLSQNLDLMNAAISTIHNDGSGNKDIPITSDMVFGYNPNTLGTQNVVINYYGYETSFTVTVVAPPDKTALKNFISTAQAQASAATIGDHEGDQAQNDLDIFIAAINAAVSVDSDAYALEDDVNMAVTALTHAMTTFSSKAVTVDRSRLNSLTALAAK
jgi:Bacterial Ig-like domain (group 3).